MTAPPPSAEPPQACPHFDPRAVRRVGVMLAPHKSQVVETVCALISWFDARGIQVLLRRDQAAELGYVERGRAPAEMAEEADLLLALGGDGTLLHTARLGAPLGTPILGVNVGGFGFLAALPQEGLFPGLEEVLAGRFRLQSRMMLHTQVHVDGAPAARFVSLNDVVVAKGAISRLLRISTHISGEAVSDLPADGVIVATPTGSTGYSLSAGGPVVDPELRAFIITPICPHTLSARTLLVPAHRRIRITVLGPGSEEVHLTADGQESMSLRGVDWVEITEASFSACLIVLADDSFYARLRDKLGWGGPR